MGGGGFKTNPALVVCCLQVAGAALKCERAEKIEAAVPFWNNSGAGISSASILLSSLLCCRIMDVAVAAAVSMESIFRLCPSARLTCRAH